MGQEAEIAHDYQGRLIYELLQNADDAMLGEDDDDDRVVFWLTGSDLWIGNSGRPLDDADVEGLCGIGISSKTDRSGPKRASIGHKGMGFKSVLEVTDAPAVYSLGHSFRMDAQEALAPVTAVFDDLGWPPPEDVPAMRFPWPVDDEPERVADAPFGRTPDAVPLPARGESMSVERRVKLAARLRELPVTALLFLRHLEQVDIRIDGDGAPTAPHFGSIASSWTMEPRARCPGSVESGIYRVCDRLGRPWRVVVPARPRRRGTDRPAPWWARRPRTGKASSSHRSGWPRRGQLGTPEPPEPWRRFHVFLPTRRSCRTHCS